MRKQTVCQGTVGNVHRKGTFCWRSWKQGERLVQKNTNKENSLDEKYLSGKGQEEHSMECVRSMSHRRRKRDRKLWNNRSESCITMSNLTSHKIWLGRYPVKYCRSKIWFFFFFFCIGRQFYWSVFIFGSLKDIKAMIVSCQQCAILLAGLAAKQFDFGCEWEFLDYLL